MKNAIVKKTPKVEQCDHGHSAETIAITFLGCQDIMVKKAKAEYPEVFFGDSINAVGMSKELRKIAFDPYLDMPPAVRGLVAYAGFIIAKEICGWKMPCKEEGGAQ